jgi:hypothetical protein
MHSSSQADGSISTIKWLPAARLVSAKPAIGEQEIDSPLDRVRNGFVSHD